MDDDMEPLLQVKNLKTCFKINKKWVPAVEEVSFHVARRRIRMRKKRDIHVYTQAFAKGYHTD